MQEGTISEFLLAAGMSAVLILLSFVLFYEILRITWRVKDRLDGRPRLSILCMVFGVFAGHSVAVWLYGIAFWLNAELWHWGDLHGSVSHDFLQYVYFSATTYSSLGFGDIYPSGAMRLLTGVEVLNGLILIGWSVTYTYFATEKYLNYLKRQDR